MDTSLHICPKVYRNGLLAALSADECRRVCDGLQVVRVDAGEILYRPNKASPYVYFPVDCCVALTHLMEDDSTLATALVGNEGMIGIAHFLGGQTMYETAINQIDGHAMRIKAAALKEALDGETGFQRRMLRYVQALMTYMGLMAACNRHHTLSQQVAHLFLQLLDRIGSDEIALTQEHIAAMLGVRRERINKAALVLQRNGAIDYARGHIKVLDRNRLRAHSCTCHALIKTEFERLLETPLPLPPSMPVCRG
ncbi:MAG: Crp/Fnr family transcriptional regulator [Betaproteobacteria bacterium]|nr:Crp/Fnr family transcriptional regulator [Betaproteobacteria bacterium]